ncbi:NAD(P)H-hydrate dehydratase [Cyanobium sp. CH-040]|uniref:NAD(P)H-hydrate dehydratase n=1 Tax=Cyanobium sp. CH-040 TaxID=2823708 RepID=UPI0020CE4864|nr:NAD(P)H-hydrate dehydratase [Cyanobium sp. CH-040]
MAALEEHLFASGLPVEALMEKAALALSRQLLADHGGLLERQGAVVLAGPGHNGGDGLVVARELHLAGVAVAIWSPFERHKPLTASHLRHAAWLGIPRLEAAPDPAAACLWIDGLLGISQRRPPEPALQELFRLRELQRPGRLVAIDVPTGLCADSGRCLGGTAARASHTYTLGLLKAGLVQDGALEWVGELRRLDLGLPPALLTALPADQPLGLGSDDLAAAPWPRLPAAAAKYGRGRLLVVAGSERYRGAANLALAGASAAGCGSLRAALPSALADGLWSVHPHVVVSRRLACDARGHLALGQLEAADLERLDALLVGPGLGAAPLDGADGGLDEDAESAAWQRLQRFEGLLVLDADGLNRLAGQGAGPWLRQRRGPTWLTPHRGEFDRLFPDLRGTEALAAAAAAARETGAAVLLKGARSVVAGPGGGCRQVLKAAPAAARAGLGDVLAGYAAALGAMALAAAEHPGDALLAAAGLAHAGAGLHLQERGAGGASPQAVARCLANASVLFYK